MATKRKPAREMDGMKDLRLFETRNDIPAEVRSEMVQLLNQQLADTFDLYSQTKQAHWNVKGKDFFQLHELFDELAESIFPFIDLIAERATALGGKATGTARMAAGNTRLPEFPDISDGMECLHTLAERFSRLASTTRKGIDEAQESDDLDTADLLTEVSRQLDKDLWFLEAHLQAD
jgi:starvation-inducible DNA-binding protein